MKLKVVDLKGKEVDVISVEGIADETPNIEHLLYLTDKYQKAYTQQGTHSSLNRRIMTGGGAKPYKQKGTGRARRGTNRSPLRRGGAVVFGPQPRSHKIGINSKVFKKVYGFLIKEKAETIFVVDVNKDELIKTKQIQALVEKVSGKSEPKVAFILDNDDLALSLASRNLDNGKVMFPQFMSVQTLLNAETIIVSKSALEKVKERHI